MSNPGLLAQFDTLIALTDAVRAKELGDKLKPLARHELEQHYAGSPKAGGAFLMNSAGDIDAVGELIITPRVGDSLMTLYRSHEVFSSRRRYIEAREDLITTIEDLMDAGPQGLAVICPTRKRAALLRELSLLQLVNVLRERVGVMKR